MISLGKYRYVLFRYKRITYLPMITWNMIDTILHKIVGRYEYPVMPLNPRIGKMRAVIIASHIDKLIKKGVQKLWSRRNLIITMMVNKLPNVPIEIKEYFILEISSHRRFILKYSFQYRDIIDQRLWLTSKTHECESDPHQNLTVSTENCI